MPILPVRIPPERRRRTAKGIAEGPRKRFRILKPGLQRNIDHPPVPIEDKLMTGPPQTQQQDVTRHADADVIGKLPMKMEPGEVGHLAQPLHAEHLAEVHLDMVQHLVESHRVSLCPVIVHRLSLVPKRIMDDTASQILTGIAQLPEPTRRTGPALSTSPSRHQ